MFWFLTERPYCTPVSSQLSQQITKYPFAAPPIILFTLVLFYSFYFVDGAFCFDYVSQLNLYNKLKHWIYKENWEISDFIDQNLEFT